jgi:Domain of unknown function (DUF4351)
MIVKVFTIPQSPARNELNRIKALSVEQVEALGEALLDFHGVDDLVRGSQGRTIKKPILFHLVRYDGAILS